MKNNKENLINIFEEGINQYIELFKDDINYDTIEDEAYDVGYITGVKIGLQIVYDTYGLEKLIKLREQMIKEHKILSSFSLSFIKLNDQDRKIFNEK